MLVEEGRRDLQRFLARKLKATACEHSLRLTTQWLRSRGKQPEAAALEEFEQRGGFCDCEVLRLLEAEKPKSKRAEMWLPIFKQGDDMRDCLNRHPTNQAGVMAYAAWLDAARQMVEELAKHADALDIDGDTHCIWVEGPADIIDGLIQQEVLHEGHEDEEEEEDT